MIFLDFRLSVKKQKQKQKTGENTEWSFSKKNECPSLEEMRSTETKIPNQVFV